MQLSRFARLALPFLQYHVSSIAASPTVSSLPPNFLNKYAQAAQQAPNLQEKQTDHHTQNYSGPAFRNSYWYDWGWHGAYPHVEYESFGAVSPRPNLVSQSDRCDDSFIFIEPRGHYVGTPGPVVLDNDGNLVWMETRWGQVMDLKVQRYKGENYITFWHGTDSGTFGEGYYLMLNDKYEVAKMVTPVGDFAGDLHEFRITDDGNALMTIYHKKEVDMSGYGFSRGWIFDSLFQEVSLETGELLFEWNASSHYAVHDTEAPIGDDGQSADRPFDFFHINSIDKDVNGDYLISSRYMCAVMCISHKDGRVLWQLGGKDNQFEDLSGGSATDMSWNHHAAWYKNTTLTLFDNGSNGRQETAKFSRGLMIDLNINQMTATLVHAYVAPLGLLAPSQGSVQVLPNENVLVGWGHTPAFTEYSLDGEVLCDTHFGAVWFANLGWAKNYRTFKYNWVGRPSQPPDVAVRPSEGAVYVSWNGATEVKSWLLESAKTIDGEFSKQARPVAKKTFETRIAIPGDAHEFLRAVAFDAAGERLGVTEVVRQWEETVTVMLTAPSRGTPLEPITILSLAIAGGLAGLTVVFGYRLKLKRGLKRLLRPGGMRYKYELLPKR